VIYTLTLSVIIGQAWKKYTDINNQIDREADALTSLAQSSRMFDDENDEIFDARGDRFDLFEQRLPHHVWIIFVVVSVVWIWGFLWLKFDSDIFEVYVLGATILSVSYLFYLAHDLDDITQGIWKVKFASFENIDFMSLERPFWRRYS
jgi:hypothetical protein